MAYPDGVGGEFIAKDKYHYRNQPQPHLETKFFNAVRTKVSIIRAICCG